MITRLPIILMLILIASACDRNLTVERCSDKSCLVGCERVIQRFDNCGNKLLQGNDVGQLSVKLICDGNTITQQLFNRNSNCRGNPSLWDTYSLGDCAESRQKGIFMRIIETPINKTLIKKDDSNLQSIYEKNSQKTFDRKSAKNVIGYGVGNRFNPPLLPPNTVLGEVDRYLLTLFSNPIQPLLSEQFIQAIGSGDLWDGYWYNNNGATGQQLYPEGLSKYYDLYSFIGYFEYLINYILVLLGFFTSPLFLFVPLNVWIVIFQGKSMEGIWKLLIPFPLVWLFGVKGEDGWDLY